MQIFVTLNNVILISIGFLLFIRLALWYFKKDSPFLNNEFSIMLTIFVFLMGFIFTSVSYAMHGFVIDRVLYISGCMYSTAFLIVLCQYLMMVREKLPDSRKNKDESNNG